MIKRLIAWTARRSHNVQVQAGMALLYGLVSIFGVKGSISIVMKLRKIKQQLRRPHAN
jgi:hypothetical protein